MTRDQAIAHLLVLHWVLMHGLYCKFTVTDQPQDDEQSTLVVALRKELNQLLQADS